jgi:hypothetical protein
MMILLNIFYDNIQLFPSYELDIESWQPDGACYPPRSLAQGRTTSRGLTTWWSPHMKIIIVLYVGQLFMIY